MTKKVIRVAPDCPVAEVLNKLQAYRISCVVVCEDDVPIGLISERDIVGFAFKHVSGKGTPARSAKDLMSSSLVTVRTFDSVDEAFELVEEHHIRHLPVVDADGRLVGLLTQTDLLRARSEQIGDVG
jgi:CBS domain-containing protein